MQAADDSSCFLCITKKVQADNVRMRTGKQRARRENMTRDTKRLVWQITAGMGLWGIVFGTAGFFLAPVMGANPVSVLGGILLGLGLAELMLVHMAAVAELAGEVSHPEEARKRAAAQIFARRLIVFGLLAVIAWKVPQVNILAVILGILGLKAGAYLQPLLFGKKNKNNEGRKHG